MKILCRALPLLWWWISYMLMICLVNLPSLRTIISKVYFVHHPSWCQVQVLNAHWAPNLQQQHTYIHTWYKRDMALLSLSICLPSSSVPPLHQPTGHMENASLCHLGLAVWYVWWERVAEQAIERKKKERNWARSSPVYSGAPLGSGLRLLPSDANL